MLRLAAVALLPVLLLSSCRSNMPNKDSNGRSQMSLEERLRAHVQVLAGDIGERNLATPTNLDRTRAYLRTQLDAFGYAVTELPYAVGEATVYNLEATLAGTSKPTEVVVLGAHYDSARNCPAANDNGSGVAGLLELARELQGSKPDRTVRFVFFVNEEPPYFQRDTMGSFVYAKACKARNDNIVAMLSLETIGYYSDAPGSQQLPKIPLLHETADVGNFIAFVANPASAPLLAQATAAFKARTDFPIQSRALPELVPGVGFSDQWSFWRQGYPAFMATDTAMFRYPHYHEPTDTPDKLDYPRMTEVVEGVLAVAKDLARE